jgi:hypothetical protein
MIFNVHFILGLISMLITLINAEERHHSNIRKHLAYPDLARFTQKTTATPAAATPAAATPAATTTP